MSLVPSNAPDLADKRDERASRRDELEFRLLESEARLKELAHREVSQRYWLRWIAVCVGLITVACMGFTLMHLVHRTFWGPFHFTSSAFAVTMIAAPIFSITSIAVALFVGAFKKFDDSDVEKIGQGAVGLMGAMKGS